MYYNILNKVDSVVFANNSAIKYLYNSAGVKLEEKFYAADTLNKTTGYLGNMVFENGILKMFGHPEGRVVNVSGDFEYQYAYSDHLGNTRMVYTSKEDTVNYLATMENLWVTIENEAFANVASTRKPDNNFDHTDILTVFKFSSYLTGDTLKRVGPAIGLHVYKGDKVRMTAYGKYRDDGTYSTTMGAGFMSSLYNSFAGVPGTLIETLSEAQNILDDAFGFIGNYGGSEDETPRAYLNYIQFDEAMEYVNSGFERIDESAGYITSPLEVEFDQLQLESPVIDENGYIFIWLSNETPGSSVHFDDLLVEHIKSPVVQVANYYPFGLQTSDSYTRIDTEKNQFLFNAGSKLNEHTGNYEMFFREYDPVLGRMTAVDPMAGKYRGLSPYNYAFNDPVGFNDPSGAEPFNWNFDMTTEQFNNSTDALSDAWGARAQRYEDSYAVNHIIDYSHGEQVLYNQQMAIAQQQLAESNAYWMDAYTDMYNRADYGITTYAFTNGEISGMYFISEESILSAAGFTQMQILAVEMGRLDSRRMMACNCNDPVKGKPTGEQVYRKESGGGWVIYGFKDPETGETNYYSKLIPQNNYRNVPLPQTPVIIGGGVIDGQLLLQASFNTLVRASFIPANIMSAFRIGFDEIGIDFYRALIWELNYKDTYYPTSTSKND